MAVIVNYFELVLEAPEESTVSEEAVPPDKGTAQQPRPIDLFDALRFRDERQYRVWSH